MRPGADATAATVPLSLSVIAMPSAVLAIVGGLPPA